jgi:hypothetical protein
MNAQLTPKQQCPLYGCQNRADLMLLNTIMWNTNCAVLPLIWNATMPELWQPCNCNYSRLRATTVMLSYERHAQTLSDVSLLLVMPGFWRPWYYFDSHSGNTVWRHIYVSFMTAITRQWQPCQSYDNHAGTMITVPLLWQPCHHYDGRAKTMTAMSAATIAMSVLRQPCQCYNIYISVMIVMILLCQPCQCYDSHALLRQACYCYESYIYPEVLLFLNPWAD